MPLGPLKYHPNRYLKTRPFAKSLLELYNDVVDELPLSMDDVRIIQSAFIPAYNDAIEHLHFDERPADASVITTELSYFLNYAAFEKTGRNIFDFGPTITSLFRQTDVDDLPVSVIQLPYQSMYLWFGPQDDLDLWSSGYYVDGAYVSTTFHQLTIMLSTVRRDIDYEQTDFVRARDRYYYFYFRLDADAGTVGQSLASVIEEVKPFEPKIHDDTTGLYEVGGKQVYIQDVHHQTAVAIAREHRAGFSTFRDSLRLIVNALCYVTAYPDDVHRRYGDDAPAAMVSKIKNAASPQAKRRVESKLASMGYTRIHFCGRGLEKMGVATSKSEMSPHWRRGHFRQQPFGPKLAHRKLVWIMPTIVRRDKGTPENGHIYLVDPLG